MPVEMTPLPRGNHGLSRAAVAESQRLRLLRAMAEVMAMQGYARTSVADVLRRARVSRETFYELFDSKEDCFLGAFELAYHHIGHAIAAGGAGAGAASDPEEPAPIDRLAVVLGQYLNAIAADIPAARVFLIEVYAAGDAALKRRLALQNGLVEIIAALMDTDDPDDRFAIEAFVAATGALVTARVAAGDADTVRDLHGPLMTLAGRVGIGQPAAADAGQANQ